MRKMLSLKILIICCLTIIQINCYQYTLPGDRNWPTVNNFTNLRSSIVGNVIMRGQKNYNPHTWNLRTNLPKPAVIIQPQNAQDIIVGLKFANQFNLRISVQSTGHHQDVRNIYDNSVHFDMSTMNSKSIDIPNRRLTLGPGNNFSQIHKYVSAQTNSKLVALSGADPGVGIYGWTVGGGHGAMTRIYGLGVDALLSIDLILANYSIVTASSTQNVELFRALRGSGGGAYGIAISLTVKLFDTPGPVSSFMGSYYLNNDTAAMFGQWMIDAPNGANAYFLPSNTKIGPLYVPTVTISANCFGNRSYCGPILSKLKKGCIWIPFFSSCSVQLENFKTFYDYIASHVSDLGGVSVAFASTSLNASNIIPALKDISHYIRSNKDTGCSGNSVLGGFSSTLDPQQQQTSVSAGMRQALIGITCYSAKAATASVSDKQSQVSVMDLLGETIMKKYSSWVYWNEPNHNFPSNDWQIRYWGSLTNYNRLLAVKQQVDPQNKFTCYHCVGYAPDSNSVPAVCPSINCTCTNTPNGVCATTPNIS